MTKIHYIGWYFEQNEIEYYGTVPGKLKMEYVVKSIKELGYPLNVFSLADKKSKFAYLPKVNVYNNQKIHYTMGCNSSNKVGRIINDLMKRIQFCIYIIFYCSRNDLIILYHSVPYTKLMRTLKVFFKRKVVCEVEELYGYSAIEDKPWVEDEIRNILCMDDYIVVNEGIPKNIGIMNRNYVVSYGVSENKKRTVHRYDDGKIHVVYAGTIEKRKLGAFMAIETSKYLPENYVMHIIGFGSSEVINEANKKIKLINEQLKRIAVQYDGYISGKELDDYLFRCHIGLSSNVMRPNFANNSFPSKVITYMCHDLSVVLGYAEAFNDSPISKKWTFYKNYEPEEVAEAICNAKIIPEGYYNKIISNLDDDLKKFIRKVAG